MKNTGRWKCSQIQLLLNANETIQSIPKEVLIFVFKDARQHQLRGAGHQNFDFNSCTKWKCKYFSQ